jgi:hypothetical protein
MNPSTRLLISSVFGDDMKKWNLPSSERRKFLKAFLRGMLICEKVKNLNPSAPCS